LHGDMSMLRSDGDWDSSTFGEMAKMYGPGRTLLLNTSYNYDNGRIHLVSAAGRIVAGDGLWRQWNKAMDTDTTEPDDQRPLDSGQNQNTRVLPNHDDGANVCYDDKAVVYIKRTLNFKRWLPYQDDARTSWQYSHYNPEMEPNLGTALNYGAVDNTLKTEESLNRPMLGAEYDVVRQGVIQNSRIEEDKFANDANEHDDAYACEVDSNLLAADNTDLWWVLSDFQFRSGILQGGYYWRMGGDGFYGNNWQQMPGEPTEQVTRTNLNVKMVPRHKTDASIQPFRHYRPITGRPDDDNDCDWGLDVDPDDDPNVADGNDKIPGDIWDY
jgi:hypothetical protein